MIHIENKEDCCGCNACVQRCPKTCISMHEDEEGFLYPNVDESLCINCGLCEKVCPVINQSEQRKPIATYAGTNPDEKVLMESSSGGVFTAIAESVIREGGVVFGAKFDDKWEVVHDYTETVEGLAAFRGSKYVQSRIGNSFLKAEEFLKSGRKVLFTGTPCQIAGLKHFLRKDFTNLLTADVVCHGVPSPLIWREYLKWVLRQTPFSKNSICQSSQKYEKNPLIIGLSFRDKRKGWEKYGLSFRYIAAESLGQNMANRLINKKNSLHAENESFTPIDRDLYMQIFLKNFDLRPSCYYCPAKSGKSQSDLTIADFWGIAKLNKSLYRPKGVSLVLANSEFGDSYINSLNFSSSKVAYTDALQLNPTIEVSVSVPKFRKNFWQIFSESGIEGVISFMNKFMPTRTDYLIRAAKEILKKFLRK